MTFKRFTNILTRKELKRAGTMFSVQEFLKKCFLQGQELPEFVPELSVIPMCMRKDLSLSEEYLMPAALGITSGFAFYPTEAAASQLKTTTLVVLTHALGHHPCESMWVWIHSFLKQGIHVLVIALDGHSKFNQSLFDLRSCSRSLPLILQRMREVYAAIERNYARASAEALNVFLLGHFMGATYSLLAAAHEPANSFVKGLICNAPTVSVSGSFEFLSQSPPVRHPIRFLKDGTKMTTYYGLAGFRKIWSGSDSKGFRNRIATACSLESQVQLFLSESLVSPDVFSGLQIPVLWIYGERDKGKGAAAFEYLMSKSQAKIHRFSDPVRSSRGIQFSQVWPEKVAKFVAEFSSLGKNQSFDGSLLDQMPQNIFSGESHAG